MGFPLCSNCQTGKLKHSCDQIEGRHCAVERKVSDFRERDASAVYDPGAAIVNGQELIQKMEKGIDGVRKQRTAASCVVVNLSATACITKPNMVALVPAMACEGCCCCSTARERRSVQGKIRKATVNCCCALEAITPVLMPHTLD